MSNYPVFEQLEPYGFVHHRALNSHEAFDAASEYVEQYPDVSHVFEGDVCWNFTDGRKDLYFRHPSYVLDSLSGEQIDEQVQAGTLFRLEDLIERRAIRASFILELKVGKGDSFKALSRLIELMQANCAGQYWVDGFSTRLLSQVKRIDPSVPTTLHTELVKSGKVLVGAPEWFPFKWTRLSKLKDVDGIAIRKAFSKTHMNAACEDVKAAGLELIISRLTTVNDYKLSRTWGALVGYPKAPFEQIMELAEETRNLV